MIEKAFVLLLLGWYGVQVLAADPIGRISLETSSVEPTSERLLTPPLEKGAVVVRAAFHLQDIDEINDEAETVQFTGVLTLTWRDERQAFDPEGLQVDEKIYQGNFQFNEVAPAWYPQVVLANESGLYESNAVLLRVKPNGTNTLIQTVDASVETDLNLRRYPFDHQRLEAVFEVLGFDANQVVFLTEPEFDISRNPAIEMSGWKISGLDASVRKKVAPYAGKSGTSSTFVLIMDVERKSFFTLRLVVLPLVLIVMLSWSVFWMDRSALGDRLNVSFIGILTAVAYQNVIGDILPQIAYVTLMNTFLNLSMFMMCATVVIHLAVDITNRQGNWKQADLIDLRCRWIFPLVYFGLLSVALVIALVFF